MAVELRVEGGATLRRVAARMRAEGRKDLTREMGEALSKATDPIRESIRASASEVMPREGGYQAAFDKSLRFKRTTRDGGTESSLILYTYADGTSERRDIRALDKGNLRHPVWGRSRPGPRKGERVANPWAVTSIRAGFFKRGTDGAMDEVQKNLQKVINTYAQALTGI